MSDLTNPEDYLPADDDNAIVSLVHVGRLILLHVVVKHNRKTSQYEVWAEDEELIEHAQTARMAVRLADQYLSGYLHGYARGRAHEADLSLMAEPDADQPAHIHQITRSAYLKHLLDERDN